MGKNNRKRKKKKANQRAQSNKNSFSKSQQKLQEEFLLKEQKRLQQLYTTLNESSLFLAGFSASITILGGIILTVSMYAVESLNFRSESVQLIILPKN